MTKNKIIIIEPEGTDLRIVIATKHPPQYLEVQRKGKPIYQAKSKKKVKATAAVWKETNY